MLEVFTSFEKKNVEKKYVSHLENDPDMLETLENTTVRTRTMRNNLIYLPIRFLRMWNLIEKSELNEWEKGIVLNLNKMFIYILSQTENYSQIKTKASILMNTIFATIVDNLKTKSSHKLNSSKLTSNTSSKTTLYPILQIPAQHSVLKFDKEFTAFQVFHQIKEK